MSYRHGVESKKRFISNIQIGSRLQRRKRILIRVRVRARIRVWVSLNLHPPPSKFHHQQLSNLTHNLNMGGAQERATNLYG